MQRYATFRHGVHPAEHKEATEGLPIERMRFVDEYILPLAQHIGAPSKCLVKVGQRVERGQMIAAAGGFISTSLHAPVTGTVSAIEMRPHPNGKLAESIILKTDRFDSQSSFKPVYEGADGSLPKKDAVHLVQSAGIVGLGGAAFPSHVKLSVPEGKTVRFLVLNGCECEPYLTCDHRVMLEHPRKVMRGLELIKDHLGAERAYIGVEVNKMDAIDALRAACTRGDIEVIPLTVKYPQGAEKALIDSVLKMAVPTGKLPLDIEIVVNNVGTAAAITDLVETGSPLIERVVTLTGPGIRRPANVMVPLGTPLRDVIEHCGGLTSDTRQLILGGPMMGMAQKSLDVPMTKGASGVLALTEPANNRAEDPCIRCGRCLEACPMFLNPSRIHFLVRAERAEQAKASHVMDCYECASCSFVCPSNIPLAQLMKIGKAMVRQL